MNTKLNQKTLSPEVSITNRKQHHIDVCKVESGFEVESVATHTFNSVQYIHTALPELSLNEISTSIDFLGKTISLPLFISCMTGGSPEGYKANQRLAEAAEKMQIPIGLGSMRVLFDHPERLKDFQMREFAPTVPILGNLGAVQLRDSDPNKIKELIEKLDLRALVIHLNCGQELFQKGGDLDFRGLFNAIEQAVNHFNIPIIVKETGFGIRPKQIKQLVDIGVTFVDLAGSGGTNWILVENSCLENCDPAANKFANWGISTAALLDASRSIKAKLLASGGIRTGMDLAKAISLGAYAGGIALPLIRKSLEGGTDAVCAEISQITKVLRAVMALTGCKSIEDLRGAPLIKTASFEHYVRSLKNIDLS